LDKLNYLEIIQEQRHDFLNHLQIITGLLQLNKAEKAQSYVKKISLEIAQASRTSRLKIPHLALVLLHCLHEGAKYEVKVELDVASDYAHCATPGALIGQVVEELAVSVLEAELFPGITEKHLKITLYEENQHYVCGFLLPEPDPVALRALENKMTSLEILLKPYAARIEWIHKAGWREIVLMFPGNDDTDHRE
jgi:sensor histidine kinase regulating citrate/malate metabolism